MKINGYGYHFEHQGRSGEEGPIDPSQQYFEGSHASDAVVRETGQNSLDNLGRKAEGPIKMKFELASMRTDDIPGIEQLREHLDAVASQTEGQQGHERMVRAAALAKEDEIQVLRISDYNTTGLTGRESLSSSDSPLVRLTRGKGGSKDDERGGSFGIGSAVGPMASELSTVIYTSLPEDSGTSVMAGYTRLATHQLHGEIFRAEGYFTALANKEDFSYLRPAPLIGPFSERIKPGTDIYIFGYRMAEDDPKLEYVREALIDNFMAAIDRGKLVVEGVAPGNHWTLDSDTLEGFARHRPDLHAFYRALQDPEPAEAVLPHLGRVRLYVNIDDRLDKKLHTITMRKPLMKIDTFKHNSISAKYAAVLMCEDDTGNKLLRRLEPPQHHIWDPARDTHYGTTVVRSLKTFVRDVLRDRASEEIGDVVEISGLARFLPTESLGAGASGEPATPTSDPNAEATAEESSSVTGDPSSDRSRVQKPSKKVQVKVHRPAVSGGDGKTDDPRHGEKDRPPSPPSPPGPPPFQGAGEEGDGSSRIPGRNLRFRSWSAPSKGSETAVISVAITAESDESGDLELVALGSGGEPEGNFELGISRVVLHGKEGEKDIRFSGNTLKDIVLAEGQMTRIDIHVPAGERYRLEVV